MSERAVSKEGCWLSIVNAAAQLSVELVARFIWSDLEIACEVRLMADGRLAATD